VEDCEDESGGKTSAVEVEWPTLREALRGRRGRMGEE
jgi:hypothetical protein